MRAVRFTRGHSITASAERPNVLCNMRRRTLSLVGGERTDQQLSSCAELPRCRDKWKVRDPAPMVGPRGTNPARPVVEETMQIGVDSFAAAIGDTSLVASPSDRLRDLLEEISHADEVGLDVFGVGEHHRKEFLDSAPAVILAAAAARTRRIRLTSAVTVLSAADPVRVFQSFATLDLLSQGRAEMVVGRGSFIEADPLFS